MTDKFRWVGAILVGGGLVVFAGQNTAPSLPLVILGARTPVLPLAFWLVGAIILGALTTLLWVGVAGAAQGNRHQGSRRRWQVRPESSGSGRSDPGQGPASRNRPSPTSRQTPREAYRQTPEFDDRPHAKPYEDWENWGQRSPASQWQDWHQTPQDPPNSRRVPKRQQQAQEQASEAFEDIATGWDEGAAANANYRSAGVSPVDDALDEIAEGWEDWEDPEVARRDNAPESRPIYEVRRSPESVSKSGTGYSYRYRSADDLRRRASSAEATSSTPVDAEGAEDPEDMGQGERLDAPEVGPDGVYDADYRVIIPPSRSLDDEPAREGDRP
ncbi:MAG: hypothetical protein O2890_11700 [Cyanobacteria bacterium]|nr:hypothetical protein [Cyanobacteriota bacterium]MDA0867058.1 hypothetical protein [Cyanobacteriota bacterium]